MRDAEHIKERSPKKHRHLSVVFITLTALLGLGLVFGAGFSAGKRLTRLQFSAEHKRRSLEEIDEERKLDEKLTFYTQLTTAPTKPVVIAKPIQKPAGVSTQASAEPSIDVAKILNQATDTAPPPSKQPAMAQAHVEAAEARTETKPSPTNKDAIYAQLLAGRPSRGEYTVQVSSFHSKNEAHAYAAALERKGLRPFVVESILPNKGGTWYRVRMGRFHNEESARRAKDFLAKVDVASWILRSE